MSELDLRYIPAEDLTTVMLNERGNKFYEEHEELPTAIIVTLKQKQALRSPFFEPYNQWRGIPLTVK